MHFDRTARAISALELYQATTERSINTFRKKGLAGPADALTEIQKENALFIDELRSGRLSITDPSVSPSTLKNK